jgi:SAM-dependent methyltransferase
MEGSMGDAKPMAGKFDRRAESYERSVRDAIRFAGMSLDAATRSKALLLSEIVGTHFGRGARISLLDIGCGPGLIHRAFGKFGWQVTGVDMASMALDAARVRNPECSYLAFSGGEIPLPSASFDVTLAICVLHHVPPPEWRDFVGEMGRLTRPGGLVVVMEHNRWNPLTRLAVARCDFDYDAHLVPARQLRKLMRQVGMRSSRPAYFLLTPFANPVFLSMERALYALPLGAQYCVTATPGSS